MSVSTVIAVVSALAAFAALAWCFALHRRLTAALSREEELAALADKGDVVGLAQAAERRLATLEDADVQRREDDAALADRLSRAVRHVGLVRYDAFPNAAGEQSFSLAMLDDGGDGFVMTSIYGRGEYRMYSKPVRERGSAYSLTEEESRAITTAFSERRPA